MFQDIKKGGTGIRTQDNGFANRGLSPLGDAADKFSYFLPILPIVLNADYCILGLESLQQVLDNSTMFSDKSILDRQRG